MRRLKCRSCRATLSIIPRMLTHSHTHNTTGAIGERTSGQQRVVIRQSLMPLRFRLTQVCAAAERSGRNRCRADLGARCRVFESPHSDQIERPSFGAVFCDIKQCALALGFFLERCRRQRILHLAFSHIFLTGEGVDEVGTFFPKCFYCRWSQRPHFLKYFAN